MCILGKTQPVSCNTLLSLPHKNKRTWNAKVLLSLTMFVIFVYVYVCFPAIMLSKDIWMTKAVLEHLAFIYATPDIQLLNASIHPLSAVRDLGVTIDCRLTMADHVTAVCRTSCEVLFSC